MTAKSTSFSYVSNAGLQAVDYVDSNYVNSLTVDGESRALLYSKDGNFLAHARPEVVNVYNLQDENKLILSIPNIKAIELSFSPNSSYLATWERWVKTPDSEVDPVKNLKLWSLKSNNLGTLVLSFSQKNQNGWEMKWTDDEVYAARLVGNEVQIFDSRNFNKGITHRLKLEGITNFSVAPGKRYTIVAFVPEKKGQPGTVRLYDILLLTQPVAQKTFFKADSVQFFWNALGTSILVLTHTDVDKTGKSYYGETGLFFLAIAGNFDCRVELDQSGPVHDVAWSPNSKEFIVVYGTMPSKATLFDQRANPIYSFPSAPRNFVSFNPHGRVFCIAGFGNLQGEIDLWDRKSLKKIGTINGSNTSHCEWSPDGRHLMTSILYKRLKVDNGIKIWHYTGVLVHEIKVKEMYQTNWRPSHVCNYPERSELSPAPNGIAVATPPPKVGVYRPPGARGMMNREQLDKPHSAKSTTRSGQSRNNIPGLNGKQNNNNSRKSQKSVTSSTPVVVNEEKSAKDKKIKQINKKIKQIGEIKEKLKKGENVELTQLKKLEQESELLKELENLEKNISSLPNGIPNDPPSTIETKVLILGCGVSGISSAKVLAESKGIHDFLILESASHCGGRLKNKNWPENTSNFVEEGANWVHGIGLNNPIFKLSEKYNLTRIEDNLVYDTIYDAKGVKVDTKFFKSQFDYFKNVVSSVNALSVKREKYKLPDMSVRTALTLQGWQPSDSESLKSKPDLANAIEYVGFDLEQADTAEGTSLNFGVGESTYKDFGEGVQFVKDNRGFKYIMEKELDLIAYKIQKERKDFIYFNSHVKSITYANDDGSDIGGVFVKTADDKTFHAKVVICTFSLGVLQHNEVKFKPNLPESKIESLQRFHMQGEYKFWGNSENIIYTSSKKGYYPLWRNYKEPGYNILFCMVVGEESKRIESLTYDEIIQEASEVLKIIFKQDFVEPSSIFLPRWSMDKRFRGAYSNWPLGVSELNFKLIKEPLFSVLNEENYFKIAGEAGLINENFLVEESAKKKKISRVLFAGEHCSRKYFGYAHGSWLSGIELVEQYF
ncbi:hypothetical protein HK099_004022 [Clydaea vesicula]|uniref:Eukaryotic translation initiation factor 2A n=1 Tax=Clydaea vesicula TaxID=447962 RepID=A0AAD5Y0J0_9FUNG|nr:hypothetical protein HK099_004022 [Clydaea vesicula]